MPLILAAIAAAALFLQMAITMAAGKKKRRKRSLNDKSEMNADFDDGPDEDISRALDVIMTSKFWILIWIQAQITISTGLYPEPAMLKLEA